MLNEVINEITNINLSMLLNMSTTKYIAGAAIIFLAFLLLRSIFTRYIFRWTLKLTAKTDTQLVENVLMAFEKPLRSLFIILGFYFALNYLPLSISQDQLVSRIFRSAVVILVSWGIYDLAGSHSIISEELKEKLNVDSILIPFFSKMARFIIAALAIVVIAQEWGYDVDGFIAGLGLGGLAFALAAKDALSNVFGGIVIIMEKPFSIGDWIATPSVEGLVEDISFRSTKIRAFAQSLITVPNSTLANEPITNYTRMGKRRITFNLGVTYDTPKDKLEKCVNEIKQMLIDHPDIHPEMVFVYFDTFNDSSLDIFLYFFTNTTVWKEYLEVKQDINFRIMEILEREGVSVAFPSRSIYFENPQVIKTIDNSLEGV